VGGGGGDLVVPSGIGCKDERSGAGKGGSERLVGSLPLGSHAAESNMASTLEL
jgi:hypothetical protein